MREHLTQLTQCSNAGLFFDRCLPVGKGNEEARGIALDKLVQSKVPDVYQSAWTAMERAYQGRGALIVKAKTVGPLALGLGGGSALEVGCAFHRVYGVVAPTGSGIKGAMRRTLLAAFDLTKKVKGYKPDWRLADAAKELNLNEEDRGRLGALLDFFGSIEAAASIDVHDAWIVGTGEFLMRDVVAVHHPDYYQKKADRPSEEDDPIPIPFVSVRPNVAMAFPILCPPEWKPQVFDLLKATLERTGLGAKTNAGYGRFQVTFPRPE